MSKSWPAIVLLALYCSDQPKQTEPAAKPAKSGDIPVLSRSDRPMFVKPTDGLKLRKEPRLNAPVLAILPFRMEIRNWEASGSCSKIDGVEGCWQQISVGSLTGWIFDGYLEAHRSAIPHDNYERLSKQYCKNIANFCECATLIEKAEITKFANIGRKKDKLVIRLDTGNEISLKDIEDASSTRRYRFERRENDFYIFQVCCWEWSERELVHAGTGRRITTFGEQLFSPNGRFILSYNDKDFSRNGIEIFDLTNDAKRVYSLEFRDISMSSIQWKDSEKIEFLDPNFPNGRVRYISYRDGKWRRS